LRSGFKGSGLRVWGLRFRVLGVAKCGPAVKAGFWPPKSFNPLKLLSAFNLLKLIPLCPPPILSLSRVLRRQSP
jgi:hypothetical protein